MGKFRTILSTVRPSGEVLRRAFWVFLLLIHSAGMISSLAPSGSEWTFFDAVSAKAIVLALTAAFCALKVANVRCLRLRPGWQSAFAATVAVAILHVGVFERMAASSGGAHPFQLVVLAGGALGVAPVARSLSRVITPLGAKEILQSLYLTQRITPMGCVGKPGTFAALVAAPRGPPS